jgi:O-antigen/teichoic acid export membrane protein
MLEYLRRLATTGAAYTASSVVSKLIAVFLLPIYTAYLSPSDYGAAEVMLAAVVAGSIIIRLGVIEAILRFYYLDEPPSDSSASRPGPDGSFQERVISTGFASLLWTATLAAGIALALAEPISEWLLDYPDPGLARLAILGLWTLTLWEFALTLLRVRERARAYFTITVLNVLVTIPVTVWLVAVEDMGADGILLGSFGTGAVFLAGQLIHERRHLGLLPDRGLLRRMLRFGLPTMPAELTLYSLNFIDRILIVRLAGLAEAGLYALAIKFAQGMNVLARGFQLAFPPLAYSIEDDDEARGAYSLIFTWFSAVLAFGVAGLWLLSRQITELLAAPEYFEAHEAVGLLATGVALYALYLTLVVILGRTGRTERSFPATLAGMLVNVGLNLALIPPLGIVGAGIALAASYLVVIVLMYAFTRNLFPVPYEWGRLALLVTATVTVVGLGELLLPKSGIEAWLTRGAAWLALPPILYGAGFLTHEERHRVRAMMRPRAVAASLRALAAALATGESTADRPETGPRHLPPEVYEQALRDEDRI